MRHPPCLQSPQTAIPAMRSQSSKYLFVSMRSHQQQTLQVASNQHQTAFIVSLRSHKQLFSKAVHPAQKTAACCWRRPLMVRQPYSVAVWAPFLSPTRGTEGVVKTIERAVGTSPVPWGERLCKREQSQARLKYAECSQPSPWENGLGESGGPSLKGQGGLVGFRNKQRASSLQARRGPISHPELPIQKNPWHPCHGFFIPSPHQHRAYCHFYQQQSTLTATL